MKDPGIQDTTRQSTEDVEELLGLYSGEISSSNNLEFLRDCSHIGKFRVRSVLGRGGQAICLLAHDDDLQRPVVIKLYQDGLTQERKEQILKEGRALAKIRSPHVAQCYGCLLYTSPSPRDLSTSRMPSSA